MSHENSNLPAVGTVVIARVFNHPPKKIKIVEYKEDDGEDGVVIEGNYYAIKLKFFEFLTDVPVDTPIMFEILRIEEDGNYEHVEHVINVGYRFEALEALEYAESLGEDHRVEVIRIE